MLNFSLVYHFEIKQGNAEQFVHALAYNPMSPCLSLQKSSSKYKPNFPPGQQTICFICVLFLLLEFRMSQ